jgi:hypothetical protein
MSETMIDVIMLTDNRYLAVVWRETSVHYMCLTTNEAMAQQVAQGSLANQASKDEVYLNIEKLVKNL